MYHSNVITARKVYDAMDSERQETLTEWIRRKLMMRGSGNHKWPSSRLRELFREQCGVEVSEEEFRGAMWDMCFHIVNPASKDWLYNVSNSSPAIVRKEANDHVGG